MTAIADAVAAIFADPNTAVDGTYLPAAGGSVAVRVIWSRPDETSPLFQTKLTTTRRIAEIEASKVAAPLRNDSIQIPASTGPTYAVLEDPRQPDGDRHIWRLELGPPT